MENKQRLAFAAGSVVLALVWGQVQFIRGFDTGSDTTLCVMSVQIDGGSVKDIASCQRVWMRDPSRAGLALWRKLSGDEVKEGRDYTIAPARP